MAPILFHVPDPIVPPTWTQYFDNTKWTALIGSWSGSDWDSADQGPSGDVIKLQDTGAWTSSYRPTKIRFSSSASPLLELRLKDSNSDTILLQANPAENTGYTITFGSFDIDELEIIRVFGAGAWSLTNIEFLE